MISIVVGKLLAKKERSVRHFKKWLKIIKNIYFFLEWHFFYIIAVFFKCIFTSYPFIGLFFFLEAVAPVEECKMWNLKKKKKKKKILN